MAAVLGMRGSGSWSSDERPTNYREMILYMYPNAKAPMMALLSKLGSEAVDDPKFTIFTKGMPNQRALVNAAGYNNTDNPVTITLHTTGDYTFFKAGHAIINERTLEVMWVTAVASNTLTCKRAVGSASLVAGLEHDGLLVIGSAHEEGADTPVARAYDPTTTVNYTQIFRNSVNQTGTARATHLRTGDQVKNAQKECMLLHHIEMEKAFIFGVPKEDLTGSQPKRTTAGFLYFVSSNILNATDTPLDIDTWEDFLEDLFSYGSESKLILCGARVVNCINKLARVNSTVNVVPKATTYGMAIWSYMSPFGEVMFKTHPLFSENPTFTSWGICLDAPHLKYRPLKGRDTKYLPNRQGAGIDGVLDEYLTEAGMELRFEQCHGVIKNLTEVTL